MDSNGLQGKNSRTYLILEDLDERVNRDVFFAWDVDFHHVDSEGEGRGGCVSSSGDERDEGVVVRDVVCDRGCCCCCCCRLPCLPCGWGKKFNISCLRLEMEG